VHSFKKDINEIYDDSLSQNQHDNNEHIKQYMSIFKRSTDSDSGSHLVANISTSNPRDDVIRIRSFLTELSVYFSCAKAEEFGLDKTLSFGILLFVWSANFLVLFVIYWFLIYKAYKLFL
jgi:hypothetical protein